MKILKSVIYRDAEIFYHVFGNGKPVVLIHGFGEDGNIWEHVTNEFKENFKVIIPDVPGSGKSGLLKNKIPVSIDDYAEAIVQVVKTETNEQCTVIGHSMGGYIALTIADKYAQLLNGFGLLNSTAYADSPEKKEDRLKGIEFIEKNGAFLFLKKSIPGLFADKFKQQQAEEIEVLVNSSEYFTNQALIQYQVAMISRTEKINVLQTTTLPVLFIIGEKDPAVSLEKSLAQCHLPAITYVHILNDVGHMAMLEERELTGNLISAFLGDL